MNRREMMEVAYDTGLTPNMVPYDLKWEELKNRRTGKTTGEALKLIGLLLTSPLEEVVVLSTEERDSMYKKGIKGNKKVWEVEGTYKMASLFSGVVISLVSVIGLKGIIFNRSDRSFTYVVKQLLMEVKE